MTDVPASTSTTSSISVGGSLAGSFETIGDHDWYRINLTAGQKIVISLSSGGATPVLDTFLTLRNASGAVITSNDDSGSGTDSKIIFTVPTTGTYYIDAGSYNDQYSGTYQLSVQTYTPPPTYTNDQISNQLTDDFWNGDFHHWAATQGSTITVNLTALTAAGQTLARAALNEWTDITGIHFSEVSTGGQMTFDDDQDGAVTNVSWSDHIISSAHVNISTQWLTDYGTSLDSYAFQTYLHEIGHALGLGHAGDYNGTATYPDDAVFANDSWATTVMSYFSQHDSAYFNDQGFSEDYAVTPMIGDILAMQQLYGLSTTTRTGDTTYGFNSTADRDVYNASLFGDVAYTIFDNGGTDTLDYSGFGAVSQLINLNPETFMNVGGSIGNISIARGVVIENAIGSAGADRIIGNSVDNILDGGGGNDRLIGGAGNDTYYVDNFHDVVVENAAQGTDSVFASANFTLSDNIEKLTLSGNANIYGYGNGGDNSLTGNSGANKLFGLGGNDIIDGGGGSDRMFGGAGDDIYYADRYTDGVFENGGEGNDEVRSTASIVLGDNVETLTLLGFSDIWGRGTNLDNTLTGNTGHNKLFGMAGNDTLDGGTSTDRLMGGTGNDTYYVDVYGDAVIENAGEGTDSVFSSSNYRLGPNIENLTLSGTSNIWGYGNASANTLTGNSGANKLYGLGGNDALKGGVGNDWLEGGVGQDRLFGGAGADSFVFRDGDFAGLTDVTCDQIKDFGAGDHIRLDLVDANTNVGGNQAFSFIGTSAFHHVAGELRYQEISGNTFVSGDTNGDGIADFLISLDGSHGLSATDFAL